MTRCEFAILFLALSSSPSSNFAATPLVFKGTVVIVDKKITDTKPLPNVKVTVDETDDNSLTDGEGKFRITLNGDLKGELKIGDLVSLRIDYRQGKRQYVIHHPLEGKQRIPAKQTDIVEIRLVPADSNLLLSHTALEMKIEEHVREHAKGLNAKIEELKPKADFAIFVTQLGKKYGYSETEIRDGIESWIKLAQMQKNDLRKQGLAAYSKGYYKLAAKFFEELATIKKVEAADALELQGDSHYADFDFVRALKAYKEALALIPAETHEKVRLGLSFKMANSQLELAMRINASAIESEKLLIQSQVIYQSLLKQIDRKTDADLWAKIQNNLGIALKERGTRAEGKECQKLLAEAVNAFRQALLVFSQEHMPQRWATTQNNLGIALQEQGTREAETSQRLLAEAVQAHHLALLVFKRDQLPQDWARTQHNLGATLQEQGIRTAGEAGQKLLGEAVQAYRKALEVLTREKLPQAWAAIQHNLGNTYRVQGEQAEGETGLKLLGEAVQAYRQALEVRTRENLPQDWANTQCGLGNAIKIQGMRATGEASQKLLAEAVQIFRNVLEVLTRENLPQDWARTQAALGIALRGQGTRAEGDAGVKLFDKAEQAYLQALLVFTREYLPQDWARTQYNLAVLLEIQGMRTAGEAGQKRLGEAVQAYRLALEVRTPEKLPQDWVITQNNLAVVLIRLAFTESGDRRKKLLEESVARLQETLAFNPNDERVYYLTVLIYREQLFLFDKARLLQQHWLEKHPDDLRAKVDLVQTYFTTGNIEECRRHVAKLLKDEKVLQNFGFQISLTTFGILSAISSSDTQKTENLTTALISLCEKQQLGYEFPVSLVGTRQFIKTTTIKEVDDHRDELLMVLDALQAQKRDQMVAKLKLLLPMKK